MDETNGLDPLQTWEPDAKCSIMQRLKIALLLVLTAAAPPSSVREHERLMSQIESVVLLPARAKPLSEYGRNYALTGKDEVVGIYLIPPKAYDKRMGCMLGNGEPCPKNVVERNEAERAAQAAAGTHRWYDDASQLPGLMDGGCDQITVRYSLSSGVISVSCNGSR